MKLFARECLVLLLGATLSFQAIAEGDPNAGRNKAGTCVACHGNDGNSAVAANPKLAGQGAKYLLKQMTDIRDGARSAPLMVGQLDAMSDQDLADIAAFYASQASTGGVTEEKWLALGEDIYRAGNAERGIPACTGCHGPAGLGNAPAGYPRLSGQHADYIAQQLRNFSVGERTNDGDSKAMRDIAERMNENEIRAVASYAAGLRP